MMSLRAKTNFCLFKRLICPPFSRRRDKNLCVVYRDRAFGGYCELNRLIFGQMINTIIGAGASACCTHSHTHTKERFVVAAMEFFFLP